LLSSQAFELSAKLCGTSKPSYISNQLIQKIGHPLSNMRRIVAIETDIVWNPLFGKPRTAQIQDNGGLQRQNRVQFQWWTLFLGVLTLASRLIFTSSPYFVDGPRHVYFIEQGQILVSFPPGYFLFGETAKIISDLLHVSVATAISIMNVSFSICGVIIFANLATRLIPGILGILLAFCYAFSDTVWFVADIHSTYAAVTFFVPAVLYAICIDESGWLTGVLWAAMTGFRPSDGVFLLPFVLFAVGRRGMRHVSIFIIAALPVLAVWYIPTVKHFGGILSPLTAAGGKAHHLANGLFVNEPWQRKVGNLVHIAFGSFNAWNILTPFLCIGCFSRATWTRAALLCMTPGLLFFTFYFFSDSTYYAYLIAPGFLLAGVGLQQLRPRYGVAVASIALSISILQMTVARPLQSRTVTAAVINAYCLKYSGWGIRNQYDPRLRDTLKTISNTSSMRSATRDE
jgi:hypothetical protein